MALNEAKIRNWLRNRIKPLKLPDLEDTDYLSMAIQLGGAQFWIEDWPFTKKVGTITLTSGTSRYQLDGATNGLDVSMDSISGVRRLTTDDDGWDLTILSEHEFNRKYPYPSNLTTGRPMECKVEVSDGHYYIDMALPPDSAYTLAIDFKLGWSSTRMSSIPDKLIHAFVQSCLCFVMPTTTALAEYELWRRMLKDAQMQVDVDQSEKAVYEWPMDLTYGAISIQDRALNRLGSGNY